MGAVETPLPMAFWSAVPWGLAKLLFPWT